ncbi:MAG: GNAT family N-acetyltransferase [Gammaproteobacteria bacterium]|jgi:predicted GNAT family N-acyltransferase
MSSEQAYRIVDADWSRDQSGIRAVRHAVFVEEQGIPESLERDGRDADCRHVLALAGDAEVIATGRLMDDGRIGRMAVLRTWRGCGVGRALLERLLLQALQGGLQSVYVHAQLEVAGFYSRAGFRLAGQPFVTADIVHVEMEKVLAVA